MQTTRGVLRDAGSAVRCSCIAIQRPSVRWRRVAAPRCSSQDACAQRGARPSICKRSRQAPGRRDMRVHAGAYQPFDFDESQYYRVEFASEPYGPLVVGAPQTQLKCVLVFQAADAPAPLSPASQVMEVFVSGDACIGLYALLQRQKAERPMALDILWQILLRGQDLSNKNWGLLRVAIVDIQGDIYHARMFFGDVETNTVMWDIDCRPSDATFLALKAKAPIYIARDVWAKCALPLRDSASYEAVQMAKEHRRARAAEAASARGAAGGGGVGGVPEDGIDPEELLPVKLLKRELEVAVGEENYDVAARLRDHPWMRLSADIELHKSIGYHVEAKRLFHVLKDQIEAQESQDGEDYETKLIRQHKQDQANGSSAASSGSSGSSGGGERSSGSSGAPAAAQADEIKSERTFD